ncbi:hypothetical protein THAOC_30279 [Thalassiosira oceanica]|uniref:Major facilitator superfamily (MFS) profile domain-containing protein n=1 Tax=Thalassiosira oceanica TaxID=159749 RepID=K0RAJ9_THAOC|nr:hypothetical protein THAOC_30279 [Thalassiosira oceanica]|eukprot:EJK50678.1 hypothetical protein THAOC_30279 [Thalassiosira oceanica]
MAVSEVAITYVNIILYALSYQLQRPVEPYLLASLIRGDGDAADDEGAANRAYGRLTSFFSAIQTVGSPVVGTLLDRIGPKKTSVLVFGGSAASYWILSVATTPALLFLSKIPTLLQHAFLVGQAIVVSQEGHDATARAAALGRMTTMYTIGATVGPALGGYLATSDMYAGARLAVVGSVISVILSLVFLRDRPGNSGARDPGPPALRQAPQRRVELGVLDGLAPGPREQDALHDSAARVLHEREFHKRGDLLRRGDGPADEGGARQGRAPRVPRHRTAVPVDDRVRFPRVVPRVVDRAGRKGRDGDGDVGPRDNGARVHRHEPELPHARHVPYNAHHWLCLGRGEGCGGGPRARPVLLREDRGPAARRGSAVPVRVRAVERDRDMHGHGRGADGAARHMEGWTGACREN